jgi:tousled-like kinase
LHEPQKDPIPLLDSTLKEKNEANLNYFNLMKESQQNLLLLEGGNNSNKSTGNSNKRKTPPRKLEKKMSGTIGATQNPNSFLTNKRIRSERNELINYYNDETENESNQNLLEESIEFSSKNINSETPLFNSKIKENTSIMNSFLLRGTPVNNNKKNSEIKKSEISFANSNFKSQDKTYIQTSINMKTPSSNFNLNNVSTMPTPDTNYRLIKKLQDENDKLYKELNDLKKEISDKEKKISSTLSENEELNKNITIMSKQFENQNQITKLSMIKYLRELEEFKRTSKKKWLNEQEYKLGKYTLQRVGQTVMDVWENGEEFFKLNNKLKEVELEKEKLEKQKKNLQSFQKKRSSSSVSSLNDPSEPSENDLNDLKELINFKLSVYQKDECEIKEQISKLEIEKVLTLLEKKRLKEEETSRFRGFQCKEKFPILAGRYLILSLLGKGGYSEVYRAYDLENNIEVACKIHQLNPQWSDSLKDNYIRHTIRENQIHKEIVHSKIVRHFDTIEIDLSSFCTVLELCSGPDLHTYLKMHKQLSEKEARGIIIQILAGLEYLNKLQRKIIHFDLKPQNIIFHNMEVKISDFGLAKIVESNCDNIELTSQGVGTYWYLPPECFDTSRNPPGISSKVDIWSLGVILYELIYGIRPFGHNYTQDKILQEGVILNASKIEFPPKPIISKPCQVKI